MFPVRCLSLVCVVLPLPAQQLEFEECTVGVASARATADGRPLLWKNRDTGAQHNEIAYFEDGKYRYLALITAGHPGSAWAGVNEKGFCIMNSVSRDLAEGSERGMGNGPFMKKALQTCATVGEFEAMLKRTEGGLRRTRANFGAIDAAGAAVIFEASHLSHVRYDSDDPKVAPEGYIVRANFAMTGVDKAHRQRSLRRYERAGQICAAAVKAGTLGYSHVLGSFCRDLADEEGRLPAVASGGKNKHGAAPGATLDTRNTINRTSTKAAVVFCGVKPGESPALTTFWAILGEPIFSVAVPCWVAAGAVAKELDGEKQSPLCNAALALKKACYLPADKNPPPLLRTDDLQELWALLRPTEASILEQTEARLGHWRQKLPRPSEMAEFHRAMSAEALGAMLAVKPKTKSNR